MKVALNQAEAAAALSISVDTFKEHVRPYIKRIDIGTRMLFPVSELQRWIEEQLK